MFDPSGRKVPVKRKSREINPYDNVTQALHKVTPEAYRPHAPNGAGPVEAGAIWLS